MLNFHMFSQPPLQVRLYPLGLACLLCFATASMCATNLNAGTIAIPNYSFELPATTFIDTNIDSWQQVPGPQSQTTGIFVNTTNGSPDHLDNCEGTQAAFIFSAPGVGIFQDYNSVDYAHTNPTHDFNILFEVGKSYDLTVGFAVSYSFGPSPGATLQLALYYRDALNNMVAISSTNITYDTNLISPTHFRDYQVHVATVRPTDAWAGKNIGISILSTVATGGVWDLDNVRL